MDLHDLSEELPTNWERIPEVARIAYDAHVALMARALMARARAERRAAPKPARIPSGDRPTYP
jgi:hypothetical protein